MSKQPVGAQFGEDFWITVHERVEEVRGITRDELGRAQNELLVMDAEAEVVPVFPRPFWARVNKRAAKVRKMALDELADAEERLVNQPASAGATRRGRVAVPGAFRRLPHLAPLAILKARVNTLGFVTAVLAVLLLLPQVVPISSLADVKPRGPLAIFFSSEDPEEASDSQSSSTAGGGTAGGAATKAKEVGSDRTTADKTDTRRPRETTSARNGTPGPTETAKAGSAGGSGAAGQAAVGSGASASPGADGTTKEGASGVTVPAAPSNLLVTAVDDTSVRIRWKDNSPDERDFEIERRGQTAVGRQTTEADTKSYIWTGLSPGTEFCFRVRARNRAGSSDWVPEQYRCVTTHSAQTGQVPVALSPLPCSNEGSMSSGSDLRETRILFRNETSQTVNIYALGRGGVREPTAVSLAPQGSTAVSTFLGNPYVVTGAEPAASCLAIFTGESWSSVATIRGGAT